MLTTSDFDFPLPDDLIAASPAEKRDASRLLVIDRATRSLRHTTVADIPSYARPGDIWIFNNSRVIPARLTTDTGREFLLTQKTAPAHWCALTKDKKTSAPGTTITFLPRHPAAHPPLRATILKTLPSGERVLRFDHDFDPARYGKMPLPPYILKKRKHLPAEELARLEQLDDQRYQTTYAAADGSVAAPTAGLHFTEKILSSLPHTFITLHVGLGTFRPVKTEDIRQHTMHAENFFIPAEAAEKITAARRRVAVGTTTVRALESLQHIHPHGGRTAIFIHPPHTFRHCDALFTNFHLPKSTLLMLVAAFLANPPPGSHAPPLPPRDAVHWLLDIYAEAVRHKYRFFSYGDAMLIL
jgi:S-adenosylmethionine:tRNA ribosyltransferase-isomerase